MPVLALAIVAGLSLAVGVLLCVARWWNATPFVRFNLVTGVFHLVSSGTMAFLDSGDWEASVTFYKNDMYCDAGICIVVPNSAYVDRIPVAYPIVIAGIISGFFHLSVSSDEPLLTGVNPLRWIDYALSSSLMVVAIAMLFGVVDVFVITGTALMQCGLMLFTMVMERFPELRSNVYFVPSLVLYLGGVWAPIIVTFYANVRDQPDFVEAIVWGIFCVFALFALVFWVFRIHEWVQNDRVYEFIYMGLSLCAKTALTWTFYGGASAMGGNDTRVVGWAFGGAVLAGVALTVLGARFIEPRNRPRKFIG